MKKIITTAVTSLLMITATTAQKLTFGFNGGVTSSSYKTKADGSSSTSKSTIGFTAGILTDIPITKRLSFQPAIQFTQKGGIEKDGDYKLTLTMNYLDIPFNFLYKFYSTSTMFYVGGGPTLALGLSGQAKLGAGSEQDKANLHFGNNDDDDFKQVDRGANILAGFQFRNGVSVALNYNMSFSNLFIDGDSENSFNNRYLGLRIGYMLSGKKK